jgi:phage gp29-like protein
MGIHRSLVWPFIYKAYSIGDFAEFLETYGLPLIIGKYFPGASGDEKASLLRAVTALGHDARAIMPTDMEIEIQSVSTGGSGTAGHMTMVQWAEKAISKLILGQTLTADDGNRGSGGLALGKVHNEVRKDIMSSDARQLAATITRDYIYPLIALNRGGIDGLQRCPRFVLDDGEADDLTAYSDALPKLVAVGFQVPLTWAQEKLRIPQPQDGEAVLKIASPQAAQVIESAGNPPANLTISFPTAALTTTTPIAADPAGAIVDQLGEHAAPVWGEQIARMQTMIDKATDLASLQKDLVAAFGGAPQAELTKLMAAALALAELKGMAEVQAGK